MGELKPDICRADWLALRAKSLGSSEAAAAIGEDEYLSPLELWCRKRGLIEAPDIGGVRAVRMGHALEPIALREYVYEHPGTRLLEDRAEIEAHLESETCEVVGWVEGRQPFIQSRAFPWRTATVDGIVLEGRSVTLMEAKAPGFRQLKKWADDGLTAPDGYRIQVWHALGIAKQIEAGALCALIGGQEYRDVRVCSDSVPHAELLQLEREFMRCVETGEQPKMVGRAKESHLRCVHALSPDDTGTTTVLSSGVLAMHEEIVGLQPLVDVGSEAAARIKELKQAIECELGTATYGELPNGAGTYVCRWQHRAAHAVKESKFKVIKFKKA